VNIDLASTINFGDIPGLRNFWIVHTLIHNAEATAITQKYSQPFSSFGIDSAGAEDAWTQLTQAGKPGQPVPPVLRDWLANHAQIHTNTYSLLGQSPTEAPDLSQVDFSSPDQFYDWFYVHQQMHDFEQQQLGIYS
jgi:hypothetical protein